MPRLSLRPLFARFDAAALRHNHAIARRYAGASGIWCVIKADAYGHGLIRTARALADVADGFALIELDAAVSLRAAGFQQPILMMEGLYAAAELPLFAEHRLIPVLHSLAQVGIIRETPLPAVYLKLNTGMNRLGLDEEELAVALESLPEVTDITLMTHFADADDERGIADQMARFRAAHASCRPLPVSLANSAALLRYPETRGGEHDWVRPGIMLYGSSPFPETTAKELGLQPVMTLASEIIAVRDLRPGDRVGYGGAFEAGAPMRIGLVACGYGDGYPRHAPTGTPVLVDGRRTRTLGRVSMDKLCVDLGNIPLAGVGTPVTLWGRFGETALSVDEVAASAGTISYELLCAMKARVPVEDA